VPGDVEAVRVALGASSLMAAGGWRTARLLTQGAVRALADEAVRCHASAEVVRLDRSPDEDSRRGNPARHLESAPGGGRLRALYRAPPLTALLRRLTGVDWVPSGGQAAFSYYRRAGHHLDVHRDIDVCDLAVITCIHETGAPDRGLAGALCLWPTRTGERLAAIRADPDGGRVAVRLRPGESLVLLGGLIPHRLEPVAAGHVRIVAPLCFRAAG
jgi:hypothetical protein